ncbi:MAG: HTH-type transcriptional regulator, sugar sensing transcriptional regulator [Thermoplasmata archaeon]|nr:HTH-type transcriptional regulator, sugar sensing transcriptional regulator [Thermoplasmata archaeon]
MDLAELVGSLQQYGLDEPEAHLYYHLCRLGPSRAAAVAEGAARKRTDAYRLLDRLVEKGFAEKSLERPARYIPRPPEEALQRALEARRSQLERLDAQRAAIAAAWPRHRSQAEPGRQRFAVHQGRSQINGLLARMLEGAEEEIVLATSSDGLSRLDAAALRAALQAKAKAGVLVRVLAKRGRGGDLPLTDLHGAQVRYADLPTFYQAVLVDAREVALFVNAGKGISGAEETVLWLNSSDVVLAQKALFDQSWALAPARGDLEGDEPRQMQVLRGRWVRGARLKEMVLGARATIAIQAPAGEAARWKRQGIADALAARAAKGVTVRLHVPAGSVQVPGATLVATPDPGGLVAVVDGARVLLSPGLGDALAAHDEEEWAVWSTRPGMADLLGPEWRAAVATLSATPVARRA